MPIHAPLLSTAPTSRVGNWPDPMRALHRVGNWPDPMRALHRVGNWPDSMRAARTFEGH
jgi:hypothetical protein